MKQLWREGQTEMEDWLYQTRPDFGVLPSLEQNTRDTTCHTMVNQPHWQPWFQIVFTTSDFMQDGICSRVGESSCVLLLVYAISFPNKREGVTSSWLELLWISIATTQEVEENEWHEITVLCLLGVLLPDTGLTEPDVSNSSEDHEDNS